MNQLVVLQEIYASLSKGGDGLQKIDSKAIEGSCPELLSELLESSRKGRIDEDVCRELSLKLQDVYEIKRLGDICRRAGLQGLAINTYNRALSLCRDPILRPVLQNNLGQAFVHQGDLAKASFYYQKSADCFAKEGDHTGLAHVLGNLGSAYRRSGDWNKAIEHCYRSLKTFEEKGDDLGIAQMTGSLGRIYADMGEKELAARYFERSLTDFQRLGDKRSAAWVLDQLGRIAGQRMDWDKALSYFNTSLSLFEEQGESQSQGIVLSNLGRIYLQMGQATAAREPLERAVLLISRQIKPGYQNALYCLAKTYSSLAKNCLQEESGQSSSRQQRLEASRLFIQAANSYQELSSTLGEGQAEINVAEAIAKSQSYLVRLCGDVRGEEALILAERAQTFLDNAAANANDCNKAKILGLQRIIAGIKEVHSIGLLANEPLMLTRALNNASEYLMSGAQEWSSEGAGGFLCQALKKINASVDPGRDPTEKLQAAAAALRQAEKHYGKESRANRIAQAAEILEGATANGNAQCQAALLLIAGAMATDSLSKIDDSNSILTWDESLHLLPITEKGEFAVNIKINDLHEPDPEPIAKTDLPVLEISKERYVAKDLILADGCLVPIKADMACKNYCQLILPTIRQQFNAKKETPLKPEDERQEPHERAFSEAYKERSEETNRDLNKELNEELNNETIEFCEDANKPEIEKESQESPLSRSKAVFLLKVMTALLVMLLAIEAILYLI
ncbi:MAG: tetratricopeptide repeat protein [Methanothrix sp.]|jgi:tetratricopeptide (TPR) repeat protein|nr:tetratricopeptide repeat protein [Methanothrix sp.]